MSLIMLMYILGMLYSCMMTHNFPLMTLSNAFLKSSKFTWMEACHFIHCSRMFLSVNICSIVHLSCLKLACSWHSLSGTPFMILLVRILRKIFDGTDNWRWEVCGGGASISDLQAICLNHFISAIFSFCIFV